MKFSFKPILIVFVLSVILLIIGFYFWDFFLAAILPDLGEIKYLADDIAEPFVQSLVFALTLALIPLTVLLIWRLTPVLSKQKRILIIGIIFIAIAVSIALRREMIKYQAKHLQSIAVVGKLNTSNSQIMPVKNFIPISSLKFELFAFAGLIIGSITSVLFFRHKGI